MLTIPYKKVDIKDVASYQDWLDVFKDVVWQSIAEANWVDHYPYRPEAKFQAIHNDGHVVLHYCIIEEYVKAQYVRPNENVWEDSCVEFFVSFDQKETYYNIEFNVLGTGLIGYGPKRKTERSRLSADKIGTVNTYSSISNTQGKKKWCMVLVIPTEVFSERKIKLSGMKAHANFYKCGDGLPNPHFLSWRPINNPTPNFHLPEFFGEIMFE